MGNIIVNADDYCYDMYRTLAINELIKKNKVNATTIIINNFDYEYKYVDFNILEKIKIGLHLNLTYGKPLGNKYKTLQEYGYFLPLKKLIIKLFMNKIDFEEVYNEFSLQVEQYKKIFGNIEYFDGHHHVHLYKGISKVALSIIRNYKINHTRSPDQYFFTKIKLDNLILKFILDLETLNSYQRSKYLLGFDMGGNKLNANLINDYMKKYNNLEIMVHPHLHMHEMSGLYEMAQIEKFNV